jgi:hypothetical protein
MITSASTARRKILSRNSFRIPLEDAIISGVIISKDCTCIGVFENPANARTKYIQNNPVANAVAHGPERRRGFDPTGVM